MTSEKSFGDIKKSNEQYKLDYLESFKKMRYEYIDDLPKEIVTRADKNYYLYKCRGNFFANIRLKIDLLLHDGIITNPDVTQKLLEFIKFIEKKWLQTDLQP